MDKSALCFQYLHPKGSDYNNGLVAVVIGILSWKEFIDYYIDRSLNEADDDIKLLFSIPSEELLRDFAMRVKSDYAIHNITDVIANMLYVVRKNAYQIFEIKFTVEGEDREFLDIFPNLARYCAKYIDISNGDYSLKGHRKILRALTSNVSYGIYDSLEKDDFLSSVVKMLELGTDIGQFCSNHEIEFLLVASMLPELSYKTFVYAYLKKFLNPVILNSGVVRYFKSSLMNDDRFNNVLGIKLPENKIHLGLLNIETLYFILGGDIELELDEDNIKAYISDKLPKLLKASSSFDYLVEEGIQLRHPDYSELCNTCDTLSNEPVEYHPYDVVINNKYVYSRGDYPYIIVNKKCPYTRDEFSPEFMEMVTSRFNRVKNFTGLSFAGRTLIDYLDSIDGFETIPDAKPSQPQMSIADVMSALFGHVNTSSYDEEMGDEDENEYDDENEEESMNTEDIEDEVNINLSDVD